MTEEYTLENGRKTLDTAEELNSTPVVIYTQGTTQMAKLKDMVSIDGKTEMNTKEIGFRG